MEGSLRELAGYRMEKAKEMLSAAEGTLETGQYKTSLNRSYYAIFHAMRAANIVKGFDPSKHSGVIAFFNKEFLKEGLMDRNLSVIVYPTLKLAAGGLYKISHYLSPLFELKSGDIL